MIRTGGSQRETRGTQKQGLRIPSNPGPEGGGPEEIRERVRKGAGEGPESPRIKVGGSKRRLERARGRPEKAKRRSEADQKSPEEAPLILSNLYLISSGRL